MKKTLNELVNRIENEEMTLGELIYTSHNYEAYRLCVIFEGIEILDMITSDERIDNVMLAVSCKLRNHCTVKVAEYTDKQDCLTVILVKDENYQYWYE